MARRLQGYTKWITALMLLVFLAPPHLCLRCVVASINASDCESRSCDCGHDADESTDVPCDDTTQSQQPCDDSNCPSCFAKSVGPVLLQPVESQQHPTVVAFFNTEPHVSLVTLNFCLVDGSLRPTTMAIHTFHPRI